MFINHNIQEHVLPVHLILLHVLLVLKEQCVCQDFTYQYQDPVLHVQPDHCYVVVQALFKHVFQDIIQLQLTELMDLM